MNIVMIIVVFLTFVAIDKLAIPKVIASQIALSADYRSKLDYGQLKSFVDLVNNDPTPKVIMIGDSITEGGGVANGDETIAHYLQQDILKSGKYYHVYNLGLQGAAPGDSYFIIKSLNLTSKDIVAYDLNVGNYGGPTAVKFPGITGELASKGSVLNPLVKASNNPVEDRLRLFVDNHWKLFAYRNMVKEYLTQQLSHKPVVTTTQHQPDPQPWYTTNWTSRTRGMFKRGDNVFSDNDQGIRFTKLMIQDIKARGSNILIYNISLNQQMMEQYNMIDRPHYDADMQRLKTMVVTSGATYQDYETVIPSPLFADSLHPTKDGNRILAVRMAKDLSGWLSGEGKS